MSSIATGTYAFEVFFDGKCPLCTREINWLKKLDRNQSILFTDITRPEFDARTLGLDYATLMKRIHGRLPEGRIVSGVEVFRQLYSAVGMNVLVRISRWPGVSQLLDACYELFAKNRLRLTGRCEEAKCSVPIG